MIDLRLEFEKRGFSLDRAMRRHDAYLAARAMKNFPAVDCDVDAIAQDVIEGRIMDWRRTR